MLAANMADAADSLVGESARWINLVSSNITNDTHPTPAELRDDIMDLMYIGMWKTMTLLFLPVTAPSAFYTVPHSTKPAAVIPAIRYLRRYSAMGMA